MRKICVVIFVIVTTLISCENQVIADFEITNNSGSRIDSLKISEKNASNTLYIALSPNEKVRYRADMTEIIKTDGSYIISYIQNNETILVPLHYFTKGDSSNRLILIDIQKDTLSIDIKF